MGCLRFFPERIDFDAHFRDAAVNAAEAARQLGALFAGQHGAAERLRELELRGDEITHTIFAALHRSIVAPLDPKDIRNLASEIDEFVDSVSKVGQRFVLYGQVPKVL